MLKVYEAGWLANVLATHSQLRGMMNGASVHIADTRRSTRYRYVADTNEHSFKTELLPHAEVECITEKRAFGAVIR